MAALLRIFGLGAVLSAVSEIWFYPVDFNLGLLELCAYYGGLGYLGWLLLARSGAGAGTRGLAAGFLAACLVGFLIEGIPVGFLYSALPFTLVWTSMAWHALLSVVLGLWVFRRIMARSGIGGQLAFCIFFGAYLGASTVELWTLPDDGSQWQWPDIYTHWTQQLAGWGIFMTGHLLLNLSARYSVHAPEWEFRAFAILTAALFGLQNAALWFPFSIVLPVLVLLIAWLIWRARTDGPSPLLVRITNWTVPITGVMVSLTIPLCATLAHFTLATYDIRLEGAAFHILWAGPVSLGLFCWAVFQLARKRPLAEG